MGPMSRSWKSATIPGSWGASSTLNSSRDLSNRIRSSRLLSGPRPSSGSSARARAARLCASIRHAQTPSNCPWAPWALPPAPATRRFRGRARLRGLSFMPHLVRVGGLTLGRGRPLFLIAGPCVIESERHALKLAEHLVSATRQLKIPFIFKASFDKANRTSLRSYRGPGLGPGLKILARIKKEFRVPVLTDVHDVAQVGRAAEVCDVIQIPAFLSRQTDLLVEAGSSGRSEEHTSELQSPCNLVCRL